MVIASMQQMHQMIQQCHQIMMKLIHHRPIQHYFPVISHLNQRQRRQLNQHPQKVKQQHQHQVHRYEQRICQRYQQI